MTVEEALDRLVSKWVYSQRSAINGEYGCEPHHYFSRRHHLLRWDVKNIVPVTRFQHELIHTGRILYKSPYQDYLKDMKNKDFKQYLIDNNLTEEEFLNKKLKEWRNRVNGK